MTADGILEFWFSKDIKKAWFNSTPELDQQIKNRFEKVFKAAINGELDSWMKTADSCLALCIVLDQFPLNMYRGKTESFCGEAKAIAVAKFAIEHNLDKQINPSRLAFLYMPLMHSENIDDQNLSVAKFAEAGLEDNLRFAKHHREIIKKYGRFPHRNKILCRESSQEEIDYLNSEEAFKG